MQHLCLDTCVLLDGTREAAQGALFVMKAAILQLHSIERYNAPVTNKVSRFVSKCIAPLRNDTGLVHVVCGEHQLAFLCLW